MWPLILFTTVLFAHVMFTWVKAIRLGRLARLRAKEKTRQPTGLEATVTILIPAWKEATTIRRCIESVLRQTHQRWNAIIIAGGPDGTFQIAHDIAQLDGRLKIIEQLPRGKNAALADGLEEAQGEVIVILDADSIVDPSWLAFMLTELSRDTVAVSGNYHPLRLTWVSRSEQMEKISRYLVHGQLVLQGSGSIAIWRDALEQAGSFCREVTVGVDWDLDSRVKQQNLRIGFAEKAHIITERPATLSEYWRNEVRWRRAHLASTWRHRKWYLENPRQGLLQITFYLVTIFVSASLLALATGAAVGAVAGWYSLMWVGLAFLLWVIVRKASLAAEIAAYEGRWQIIFYAWSSVVLLFISFLASLLALFTPGKLSVHFQGPRHVAIKHEEESVALQQLR